MFHTESKGQLPGVDQPQLDGQEGSQTRGQGQHNTELSMR